MTATLYFHDGSKRDVEYAAPEQLLDIAILQEAFAFAGAGFYGIKKFGRWLMSNERTASTARSR